MLQVSNKLFWRTSPLYMVVLVVFLLWNALFNLWSAWCDHGLGAFQPFIFFLTPTDLLPTGEEQVGCWWGTLTWQIVICYLYQGTTGNIWPLSREETLFSWTCLVCGEEFNAFESDNGVFLYPLLQLLLQIRDISLLPPSNLFHYDLLFATCNWNNQHRPAWEV